MAVTGCEWFYVILTTGHSYGGGWYGTATADLVWERRVPHVIVVLSVGDEGF